MSFRCCIPNCPSIANAQNASRFIEFPKEYSTFYTSWVHVFQSFRLQPVKQTGSQLICPLHCTVESMKSKRLKRRKRRSCGPARYLTPHDIELLKLRYSKINQSVAHWLCLTKQNNPEMPISDDLVIQKAKEVAAIMSYDLDFELGWLHDFEEHLKKSDMYHWRNDTGDVSLQRSEEDLREEPAVDQSADGSIRSYKEALDKVTQLQSYVERMNNNAAVELILHVKQVLQKTLE